MKLFSTCMSHISQDFFYTLFNSIFTNREAKYFLDHTHYKPFMFHDIQLSSDGEVLPIFIKLSLWAHYLLLTFQLVLPATLEKYDLHLYLFLLTRNVTSELYASVVLISPVYLAIISRNLKLENISIGNNHFLNQRSTKRNTYKQALMPSWHDLTKIYKKQFTTYKDQNNWQSS